MVGAKNSIPEQKFFQSLKPYSPFCRIYIVKKLESHVEQTNKQRGCC